MFTLVTHVYNISIWLPPPPKLFPYRCPRFKQSKAHEAWILQCILYPFPHPLNNAESYIQQYSTQQDNYQNCTNFAMIEV